jgi:Helix-turn-helix.
MEYPNNLRKIRLSQKDKNLRSGNKIAELLNLSVQYYYDLETGRGGKRLNSDHLTKLAEIFKVSTDEILGKDILSNNDDVHKKPKDLLKYLDQAEVMFDGELYDLDEEDKQKVREALEYAFWHAKQKNKRKKS